MGVDGIVAASSCRSSLAVPTRLAAGLDSPLSTSASMRPGLRRGPGEVDLVEEVADERLGALLRLHPCSRRDLHRRTRRRGRTRHTRARRRTGRRRRRARRRRRCRVRLAPRQHRHRPRPAPPATDRPHPAATPPGPTASRSCVVPCVPSRPPLVGPARKTLAKTTDFATRVIHSSRHAGAADCIPCTSQRRASPWGSACCAVTPDATCPPTSWPACSSPPSPSPSHSATPSSPGCRCRSASTPCRRPCSPTRCSAPRGCSSSARSPPCRCSPARSCAP